ncbi:zinc ribbon domain-containing protein [Neobacillus sp. LXY-4]|uniref:zinc ribbon domain-containing protein n=1 Tax=Neobacillus sp. LXY-4 TaxID=3379826 RepID=UPI003EDFCD3D
MKNETGLRILAYSVLGLIAFWLVKALFFPTGYGMTIRYNMPVRNGSEHGYMYNYGMNSFGSSISQLLFIIFIIALIVGLVMIVKNYLFTPEDIATIKGSFSGKINQVTNSCDACGKELKPDWKVCPNCGKEVVNPDKH